MKITDSLCKHSVITHVTHVDLRMRNLERRVSSWRRTMKYASPLLFCLMIICLSFMLSPSGAAGTAPGSETPPVQPRSLSLQQQRPRNLQAETPQISNGALTDQEIQRNPEAFRAQEQKRDARSQVKSAAPGENLAPEASALDNTFDAINFNEDATLNGSFHIPPDPAGAVGLNHVVNVVNTSIEFYTKGGARTNRQRLDAFFASLSPLTTTFDPKVIYDQYSGRFIVMTMERTEAPNTSRVFFAVSDDSDPNGTWFYLTLATEETIGSNQSWADFPGLAVDSEAVYFTTNMFAHNNQPSAGTFTGQRTWIIAKAPWYSNGTPVATRFDTVAVANADLGGDGGAATTTMQPTQMYGDTPGGVGTYLIAYGGLNDGVNLFVQVIRIDSPLSSPVFTERASQWGTVAANDDVLLSLPSAPQLGSARTIMTNDRRFSQNGVFRGGFLYCAAPIRPPAAAPTDANQVTVHWFRIDPVLIDTLFSDPAPTDQGNIGGEDIAVGTYTFFPSVAVDSLGDMAVGFAASGPNIFPGAYFAGRLATDAGAAMRGAGGLRAGRDFYVRTFSSPTAASRWGDYSGMWLDPSDELTFCAFNEYALPRGTTGVGSQVAEDGRWGTAWGCFSLSAPAATAAGQVIISEFRMRGPDPDGGGPLTAAENEFIELYNNTDSPITVNDVNPDNPPITGPSGWAIVSSDNLAAAKAIIPTGTTIPARGHYLVVNSDGYSLSSYPSGNNGTGSLPTSTTASGDRTYTTDIPDNIGIALFRSANPGNYLLADRLDAVGPTSEANVLFREGAGYPPLLPSDIEYTFYRNYLPSSFPKDTNDNAADFLFADPDGLSIGAGQRLGAPGPENLSSPIHNATGAISLPVFDNSVSAASLPNFEFSPSPVPNGANGTITVRRRLVNNTGASISRVRFRFMDITTFPPPGGGVADLRVLATSPNLTLETPPTQPNGGGFNSSLGVTAVTLGNSLLNGDNVPVDFVFGIATTGCFRFVVIAEALPDGANTVFSFAGTAASGSCGPTAAPGSIRGAVTTAEGSALAGVTMRLSGQRSATAISDSQGNYQFDGVDVDNFYTVTPALVNHRFSPVNRSFSIIGSTTEANFTGVPETIVTANAIDSTEYFVRQHYLDFLGREPDQGGFAYWSDQINQCGSDATCIRSKRTGVSAAFFIEAEFQQTGSFIYRLYKSALGRHLSYREFISDRGQLRSGPDLEANKTALAHAFVQRAEFIRTYQSSTTAASFVDALLRNVEQSTGVDLSAERNSLIGRYETGAGLNQSRSLVVKDIAESAALGRAVYNKAFVLMQYFGYLQRDPDQGGYDFWLDVVTNRDVANYRSMVCAFISSAEYQRRFGSLVTRTDSDCGR